MATNLLAEAIQEVGGKEWTFEALARPRSRHLRGDDLQNAVSMQAFISDVCRKPQCVKSTTHMFDFYFGVAEFGGIKDLPDSCGNNASVNFLSVLLPAIACMGVISDNLEDGTMNILKILHFADKVATNQAVKLCTGQAYVVAFRSGPWAARKASQTLPDRVPGHFVFWHSVMTNKKSQKSVQRSNSSQWAISRPVWR